MNLHIPTLVRRKRDGEHLHASQIPSLIGGSALSYESAAPSALIVASNHFEVAIAPAADQG